MAINFHSKQPTITLGIVGTLASIERGSQTSMWVHRDWDLIEMQILVQKARGGASDFACLTNFQVKPTLVQQPHFEKG